jgi:hypothetical protein
MRICLSCSDCSEARLGAKAPTSIDELPGLAALYSCQFGVTWPRVTTRRSDIVSFRHGETSHQKAIRPKGMQDGGERIWPACKLRVAVLNEPVANHQTKRYRIPGPSIGRRRRHVEGEHRHYSPSNGGHAKPASRLQRSWAEGFSHSGFSRSVSLHFEVSDDPALPWRDLTATRPTAPRQPSSERGSSRENSPMICVSAVDHLPAAKKSVRMRSCFRR